MMASPRLALVDRRPLLYAAVLLQIAAWFSVFYVLYYVVPAYKKILDDFQVKPPGSFSSLVAASDVLVIYGGPDAVFPWLLIAFLIVLMTLNLLVIEQSSSRRARSVWCTAMLLVPACILILQMASLATIRLKIGPELG
jgi:type II secretory pathway component PulF